MNDQSYNRFTKKRIYSPRQVLKSERGRPREFNPETAIAAATKVFWDHGYHPTSIDDLCRATGVLRGSLYSAFGDKRGMLMAALDHYAEKNLARLAQSLRSAELSREGLREALLYYTRTATTLAGHHGCFVTNTALEMIPDDREVAERVTRIFRRMVALLTAAIVRGQAAGVFNPELDERTIGNFLLCAIQGLRVLGKVNHDERELAGIVDMVMRALT